MPGAFSIKIASVVPVGRCQMAVVAVCSSALLEIISPACSVREEIIMSPIGGMEYLIETLPLSRVITALPSKATLLRFSHPSPLAVK